MRTEAARFGSSKPVSQEELREARKNLTLLKAKMRTEPPPYFAEEEVSAPIAQGNYRKAFKPQMKSTAVEEDFYEPPKKEQRKPQAKAAILEEDDYYEPPPIAKRDTRRPQVQEDYDPPAYPKKEPRRPQNYSQAEDSNRASYQFESVEGAEGGGEDNREECPDCGRKFNPEAMEKHSKICKKVFMTKRKKFDISSKRAAEGAAEVAVVDEMPANRRKPARAAPQKAPPGKDNKWKRQSEQFRANMRAARMSGTDDQEGYEEARRVAAEAEDSDLTRCEHCNRTFNSDAAARHIPICARKAKEAAMKNRGSKAPIRGKRCPVKENQ